MAANELNKKLLKRADVKIAREESQFEQNLAKLIIRERLKRGLTQSDLAKMVGTKQSGIARLESGDYPTSTTFLKKLSKALGLSLQIKDFVITFESTNRYSYASTKAKDETVNINLFTNADLSHLPYCQKNSSELGITVLDWREISSPLIGDKL